MSAFVSKRGTTKVTFNPEDYPILDKEEWIEVRNGVTVGMIASMSENGTAPVSNFLLRSITGWSFDEDINEENIEDLDLGIAMAVWEKIQESLPLAFQAQLPQTTEV